MIKTTFSPPLSILEPTQHTSNHSISPTIDPQIEQAAIGMEEMFADFLLQAMRKTLPAVESNAVNLYQSMSDTQIAKQAAQSKTFGLANQLIEYFTKPQYNIKNQLTKESP